jgi:hypothetical protein
VRTESNELLFSFFYYICIFKRIASVLLVHSNVVAENESLIHLHLAPFSSNYLTRGALALTDLIHLHIA